MSWDALSAGCLHWMAHLLFAAASSCNYQLFDASSCNNCLMQNIFMRKRGTVFFHSVPFIRTFWYRDYYAAIIVSWFCVYYFLGGGLTIEFFHICIMNTGLFSLCVIFILLHLQTVLSNLMSSPKTQLCLKKNNLRHWNLLSLIKFVCWQQGW